MILRDRVAIVTASGSGIGRAGAAKMASEGATVILADLSPERSEEAASQICDAGDRAEAHPTDVTDAEAVVALVEETLSAARADRHPAQPRGRPGGWRGDSADVVQCRPGS